MSFAGTLCGYDRLVCLLFVVFGVASPFKVYSARRNTRVIGPLEAFDGMAV